MKNWTVATKSKRSKARYVLVLGAACLVLALLSYYYFCHDSLKRFFPRSDNYVHFKFNQNWREFKNGQTNFFAELEKLTGIDSEIFGLLKGSASFGYIQYRGRPEPVFISYLRPDFRPEQLNSVKQAYLVENGILYIAPGLDIIESAKINAKRFTWLPDPACLFDGYLKIDFAGLPVLNTYQQKVLPEYRLSQEKIYFKFIKGKLAFANSFKKELFFNRSISIYEFPEKAIFSYYGNNNDSESVVWPEALKSLIGESQFLLLSRLAGQNLAELMKSPVYFSVLPDNNFIFVTGKDQKSRLEALLKIMAALKQPEKQEVTLPDKTVYRQLVANPENFQVLEEDGLNKIQNTSTQEILKLGYLTDSDFLIIYSDESSIDNIDQESIILNFQRFKQSDNNEIYNYKHQNFMEITIFNNFSTIFPQISGYIK